MDQMYNKSIKNLSVYKCLVLLMALAGINGCSDTDTNQKVEILKPAAGDTYIAGDTMVVNWRETIDLPHLSYRYSPLETWDSITAINVTGKSVQVRLPDTWYSDSFQIRVEDRSGKMNASSSDYFSVVFIKLLSFDNDTFHIGDTIVLKWNHNPSKFIGIRVKLSTNGGKTFNDLLSKSLKPELTEYKWVVGQETSGFKFTYPSDNCEILVQDYSNTSYADHSATFSIFDSGGK